MIDDKDQKIINILLKSGRESASGISEKLNLSVPTVIDRIKKMQDSDIISGFKAVINYKKIGLDVSALITIISESSSNFSDIVNKSKETPEVISCFATTGHGSHVMVVNAENTNSLERILRKIQSWPGVKRTETQIILSSYEK
jgi:Lrp/AsnC family leucine-responsive transcriptional regulator